MKKIITLWIIVFLPVLADDMMLPVLPASKLPQIIADDKNVTISLLEGIKIPTIDFENIPIQTALEILRSHISDVLMQWEIKGHIDLINRTSTFGKKVSLKLDNRKVTEIFKLLAEKNNLNVIYKGSQVFFTDNQENLSSGLAASASMIGSSRGRVSSGKGPRWNGRFFERG